MTDPLSKNCYFRNYDYLSELRSAIDELRNNQPRAFWNHINKVKKSIPLRFKEQIERGADQVSMAFTINGQQILEEVLEKIEGGGEPNVNRLQGEIKSVKLKPTSDGSKAVFKFEVPKSGQETINVLDEMSDAGGEVVLDVESTQQEMDFDGE